MGMRELSPASSSADSPPRTTATPQWALNAPYAQQTEDDEDMQMVEDSLLFGTPAVHYNSQPQHSYQPPVVQQEEESTASYAAMDPFFAQQYQASQVPATPSFFAQPSAFAFQPASSSTTQRQQPSAFARRY